MAGRLGPGLGLRVRQHQQRLQGPRLRGWGHSCGCGCCFCVLLSGQGEGEGKGSTCRLQTLAVDGTTLCGTLPVGVARPETHQTKKQTKMHRRHSSPWSVTTDQLVRERPERESGPE